MKRSCKYEFATATKVHTSHKYDETRYHLASFAQKYEKKTRKTKYLYMDSVSRKEALHMTIMMMMVMMMTVMMMMTMILMLGMILDLHNCFQPSQTAFCS